VTSYLALLAPSANRVYTEAAVDLTVAELEVFNATVLRGQLHDIAPTTLAGLPYLGFNANDLDIATFSNVSSIFALFEASGELLRPVPLKPLAHFDDDLITIPKYAGKTNEQFTRLLLNVTVASSASAPSMVDGPVRVLDPLCGRGTTLNQAMVYGYDVAGIELDGKDFEAYQSFLRTYLQRKRVKHRLESNPVRRDRKLVARRLSGTISTDTKALDIDVVHADTTAALDFFKPATFDAIVTDAPYGVQHGSRTIAAGLRRSPLQLLAEAVPGWAHLLRPGGALGMSWNTHVAAREEASAVLAESGLTVFNDGPYGRFKHRVDASITRDILIARK
jgi:SAM-dependent methyltransferase